MSSSVEAKLKEGWHASLAEGLAAAEREGKPVLIDLWATWCKNCLTMDKTTLGSPEVTPGARRLREDQGARPSSPTSRPAAEVMKRFKAVGLPAYAILKPARREMSRQRAPAESRHPVMIDGLLPMRTRHLCLSALVLALSSGAALSGRQAAAVRPVASHAATAAVPATLEAAQQTVTQTCVGCHSNRAKAGGLSLEGFAVAAAGEWEKAGAFPTEFQARLSDHTSQIYQAWTTARPENDFKTLAPLYCKKRSILSRELASFFPRKESNEHIADPLIDFSDEGMTVEIIRPLFARTEKRIGAVSPGDFTQPDA